MSAFHPLRTLALAAKPSPVKSETTFDRLEGHVRPVVRNATSRAAATVVAPLLMLGILAYALARSGYGLADYPNLIASGRLSLIKHAAMWAGLTAWVVWFVPPAITALGTPFYLGVADGFLVSSSGQTFSLDTIESITTGQSLSRHFVSIRTRGSVTKLNATYAQGASAGVRAALRASPLFAKIRVT